MKKILLTLLLIMNAMVWAQIPVPLPPQAPDAPSPIPPNRNPQNVAAIYCGYYTPLTSTTFGVPPGIFLENGTQQGGNGSVFNNVSSGPMSIQFASPLNITSMVALHIDLFDGCSPTYSTPYFSSITFINPSQQQTISYSIASRQWGATDIDLSQLTIDKSNITQIQVAVNSCELAVDNIYFWKAQLPPTLSNFSVPIKSVGAPSFALTAPTSNSTGTITYASSNSNVATVVNGIVTLVGAGTATITANQASTSTYSSGSITSTLYVFESLGPPTVTSPYSFCAGTTLPNNLATPVSGAYLRYYNLPTGGTNVGGLPSSLTTSTTYHVCQVFADGSESSRVPLVINVLSIAIPPMPGVISGTTSVASFIGTTTSHTYSIVPVANASSYLWYVPDGVTIISGQGTTSINVNFANVISTGTGTFGTIAVKSVSSCGGSSTARVLTLTKALPTMPGIISKSTTNVCAVVGTSATVTYSIAPVATATSYAWTVPTGATIIGNATSTSIAVNYTTAFAAAGTVTVKSVNGAGASAARSLAVSRLLPLAPYAVTGQMKGVCGGNTYSYTITAGVNATAYNITGPVGSIVTDGTTTNNSNTLTTSQLVINVTFPANYVSGTIIVSSSNGCATSATSKTIAVSRALGTPTVITGAATVCANTEYTFTTPTVANVSYTWVVPTGVTILSGQGTNTITVAVAATMATTALLKVKTVSLCGISSGLKSFTLTKGACKAGTLNESSTPTAIVLYPNPAQDVVNFDIPSNELDQATIALYTVTGALIREQKALLNPELNTLQIATSDLPSGIYLAKISFANNDNIKTLKFSKE
jgi:hypothetical protein